MRHWLAHFFGMNESIVVTWWEGGVFYVCHRCSKCGKTALLYKSTQKSLRKSG